MSISSHFDSNASSGHRVIVAEEQSSFTQTNFHPNKSSIPLIDISDISSPQDIKKLPVDFLVSLCSKIRDYLIDIISMIGGHLGASLGVTELTVALHYVFDAPTDKIVWDIGHQAHVHKILTGRAKLLLKMKSEGGLSGFCSRNESIYDTIGAGHCSTSLSSALGIAISRELQKDFYEIIPVIGDASLASGMAFEALNNIAVYGKRMIVILNDNDMSICPSLGGLTNHLQSLKQNKKYITEQDIAQILEDFKNNLPATNNIFTNLGIKYIGPIDGHNLLKLVAIFKKIQEHDFDFPIIMHVVTEKGKGWDLAKERRDRGHGITKKNSTVIGEELFEKNYTEIFSKALDSVMQKDNTVVAISPAMVSGSGLLSLKDKYPDRVFDVTISEQHAITFGAGLAIGKYKPFCCFYSTFLQRAYDQLIHDVAIQKLPVRFIIDRAGYVGPDDPTHSGSFDIAFLRIIPNIILMAPCNSVELEQMVNLLYEINSQPSALRFPRNKVPVITELYRKTASNYPLTIGKAQVLQQGENFISKGKNCKIALVGYGAVMNSLEEANEILRKNHSTNVTLVNARFAKPLDNELFISLANTHDVIITVEDGSIGGFGSIVAEFMASINYKGTLYQLNHPDKFMLHNSLTNQYKLSLIDSSAIVNIVSKYF